MALNWILGHKDQNSYVNATYADEYFKYRTDTKAWDDLVKIEKQAALVQAAQDMEAFNYVGDVWYDNQGMQFPRKAPVSESQYGGQQDVIEQDTVTGYCASPITRTTFANDGLYSTTYGEYPDDFWKNGAVHFTNGTPMGEVTPIRGSDSETGVVTFDAVATPTENTEFIVFAPLNKLILQAQCEQALYLLQNTGMSTVQAYKLAGVGRIDIGDVRVDYQSKNTTRLNFSPVARKLLGRWIRRNYIIYRA